MKVTFYSETENKTVHYDAVSRIATREKKTWEADNTNLTHRFDNLDTCIKELTKKGYIITRIVYGI